MTIKLTSGPSQKALSLFAEMELSETFKDYRRVLLGVLDGRTVTHVHLAVSSARNVRAEMRGRCPFNTAYDFRDVDHKSLYQALHGQYRVTST
jgi:hypothetical protein